jgi:hypothetical protein
MKDEGLLVFLWTWIHGMHSEEGQKGKPKVVKITLIILTSFARYSKKSCKCHVYSGIFGSFFMMQWKELLNE